MPKLVLEPPLLNASGILSYPDCFELWERKGVDVGGWITKSYTLSERPGNENPTLCELPYGMGFINSMGLPNPGVLYDEKKERDPLEELAKTKLKKPLIVSVAGFNNLEYWDVIKAFEKRVPNAAAYELNLSCPNITPGEKSIAGSIGDSPELVTEIVHGARKLTSKPIIAKISPACPVKKIAKAAEEGGADYIGCANTMPGLVLRNGRPVLAGGSGGLSGRMLKPINLKVVYDVYETINTEKTGILGCGGIESIEDIMDYCAAGAEIFVAGSAFAKKSTTEQIGLANDLARRLKPLMPELEKARGNAHKK